jgi:hypothetical protein
MEGTGSYGPGLLRFLTDYGFTVIEVDRPDLCTRRRNGKPDVIDAKPPPVPSFGTDPPATPSRVTPRSR